MITVGFDFGTHQTKVCIEDRKDKSRPVYRFMQFTDLQGNIQYVLPSVIQINSDNTLSYGYVDSEKRQYIRPYADDKEPTCPEIVEPELILPQKPKLPSFPPKPKANTKTKLDWKEQLLLVSMRGKKLEEDRKKEWEQEVARVQIERNRITKEWEKLCKKAEYDYSEKIRNNQELLLKFQKSHSAWEQRVNEKKPLIYRYFKQATFSRMNWDSMIKPEILSVWYIAYVLFDIYDKYDTKRMGFQMGIPTGYVNFQELKEKASAIVVSAFFLVEDIFNCNKEKFLHSTYQDLIKVTKIFPYSRKEKEDMGILLFPEAYASLLTLTSKNQLEHGMNLLVDIGGGTTDVSFFIVAEKDKHYFPLIYKFFSIPCGINFIVERSINGKLDMSHHISLDSPDLNKSSLDNAKRIYRELLDGNCNKLLERLETNFRCTGRDIKDLRRALLHRPVVYTGGGSTFEQMKQKVFNFSEIKHMGAYYWQNMNIEELDELSRKGLCPILSVALGLSVFQYNDDITIKPLDVIFNHIILEKTLDQYAKNYELDDD